MSHKMQLSLRTLERCFSGGQHATLEQECKKEDLKIATVFFFSLKNKNIENKFVIKYRFDDYLYKMP